MAMPWTQARDFTEAVGRIERERVVAAAVAARAAHADDKSWREWVRQLGAE